MGNNFGNCCQNNAGKNDTDKVTPAEAPPANVQVTVNNNNNNNAGNGNNDGEKTIKAASRKPIQKSEAINVNMTGCSNAPVVIQSGNGNIKM